MQDSKQHQSEQIVTSSDKQPAIVSLRGVNKCHKRSATQAQALVEVNLDIQRGECVAVVGKSGSGKTTLINLITGIDSPTSGEIYVDQQAIQRLDQNQLAVWRGRNVGVVFQFFSYCLLLVFWKM